MSRKRNRPAGNGTAHKAASTAGLRAASAVARNIDAALVKSGLVTDPLRPNLRAAAEVIGMSPATLVHRLRGDSPFTLTELVLIARATGVPMPVLVKDTDL